MSIKPILKYPGAKWRQTAWIVAHLPVHTRYLEPYAGSAAVFFSKAPAIHEVLGDTNSSLINLFRVIREHADELAWRIEMTPWAEEEYATVERPDQYAGSGDAIEDARRFLVRCWQAHGTKLGSTCGWRHNGTRGKAFPVRLWRQLPERLLAVVDRLKEAEIRHRAALELITYYQHPDYLIYADPPYPLSTRTSNLYPDEMIDADHLALLNALDAHPGPVVLSGYTCPLYDERLIHWRRVTVPSLAENARRRTEVLWLNRKAQHAQMAMWMDTTTREVSV